MGDSRTIEQRKKDLKAAGEFLIELQTKEGLARIRKEQAVANKKHLCLCGEHGLDGTANHGEKSGIVFEIPGYPGYFVYPCTNHVSNYAEAGWKEIKDDNQRGN